MDFKIRGRIALVAGGSQGMGRMVASMLAAEGCKVAVVARDQGRIDRAVEEIRAAGGTAMGISADLATEEGVKSAVDAVRKAWGPPEIVISQTNDFTHGRFFEVDEEDLVRVFRVFTIGFSYLARAVIPDMRKGGWGRIVHIGSATAKEPDRVLAHAPANTVRSSTVTLAKTLADEFARDGITVNVVAPGYIMTDTMRTYFEDLYGVESENTEDWVQSTRGIPAERHGTVEEIGAVVTFLCSQQAGYMTGEVVTVDGGLHRSAW